MELDCALYADLLCYSEWDINIGRSHNTTHIIVLSFLSFVFAHAVTLASALALALALAGTHQVVRGFQAPMRWQCQKWHKYILILSIE